MAALRRLASHYDRANATWPVVTKSITSCLMLGSSDALCQRLVPDESVAGESGGAPPLDLQRMARMASWGLLVNGPVGHAWYLALDKIVRLKGGIGVAAKVAVDQAVWTPPLTFGFFCYEGCLQGEKLSDAGKDAAEKLWPTLQANWMVWPFVHVCTFSLIPLNYRVLWVNCANFLWSGFLSMQAHAQVKPPPGAKGEGGNPMRRSSSVCPVV